MRKRRLLLPAVILVVLTWCSFAYGQSQAETNGLNYLTSTQNLDGSWGTDTSSVAPLPATVSVMETPQILNQTDTANYSNALSWLQAQDLETTDYLSERVLALSTSGSDINVLITYIDDLDYAWGGDQGFAVDTMDTALALQALNAVNYSDQTTIGSGIDYLISAQNTDGGWGLTQGDDSNVYITALVSSTLQEFPQTISIATAINNATNYLVAHQNTDGGFGNSASTVYETSLAYMALVGVTTDNTVLGNAMNLKSGTLPT